MNGDFVKLIQSDSDLLGVKFTEYESTDVNQLHALRSRMINVKANLSSKYRLNLLCPACESAVDDQLHVLECKELISQLKSEEIAVEKVTTKTTKK